jgi:2-hydroxycyclohexanecarboxyl-CoA dehydrogenase
LRVVEREHTAPIDTVARDAGQIDILVNNAGCDTIGSFLDSKPSTWQRLLAVNLLGTIACTHAALPHLIERGGGAIVCIASDAGSVGSSGEVVYSATKGGVIAFGKALAREVARHRIRVKPSPPAQPTHRSSRDSAATWTRSSKE